MRLFFCVIVLLVSCNTLRADDTTDRLSVKFYSEISSPISLNPGPEDVSFFTVSLEGSSISYTGYEVYVQIPNGMQVLTDEGTPMVYMAYDDMSFDENDIYPYTTNRITKKKTYTHTVQASIQDGNVLCVVCYSGQSEDFTKFSGDLFHVMVSGSPYMKTGDVNIDIPSAFLAHNEWSDQDQQNHAISYKPIVKCGGIISVASEECSLPLNVSASNHWSTCILPFDTELPSGVKAYTSATSDAENIFLTEASSLEAYTPYILYSESGYSGTVSGTVDANGYPESGVVTVGNLTGAIAPQTVTEGFILQKHNDVVQFYAIGADDSFLVPAGKCWMNIANNQAKALNFVIEDGETAIKKVTETDASNAVYDLMGRRVSAPKAGSLYIKGGEKFISK